jgi:hypothetical protein
MDNDRPTDRQRLVNDGQQPTNDDRLRLTLGCWITTDDDRPTTMDARCVQREANTDNLAAVRANVFFSFHFS